MMEAIEFEGANAMLAPTWRRLALNDARIALPEGLHAEASATREIPAAAIGAEGDFDAALDEMQAAWEASHPAPTQAELDECAAALAAEADATYGGTAQSDYQKGADALEEARSLRKALEGGIGEQAAAWIRSAASHPTVIHAQQGAKVSACISIKAKPGTVSAEAIDIIADAGSTVSLSLICSSERKGTAPALCDTVAGTSVRVIAAPGAQVSIMRTQALDAASLDLDDTALLLGDAAHVDVRQTVLGGASAYTGLGCDLRGDASRIEVDTRYIAKKDQKRDFNYIIRHHGQKSLSNLSANGVLSDAADKVLRGTIDLIHGAKGAEGQENESVLIIGDDVRNRTVPVILCNEDDVAGNHGATIGHIRPEQMFYLASRGLSPEAAEQMFAHAIVEQAILDAPDEQAREVVKQWATDRETE